MPQVEKHSPGTFCWFELGTTDQNDAKRFYTSLFGWAAHDNPMGPSEYYTLFKLEGRDAAAAYTVRPHERTIPPHWMLYIAVESADESAKKAGDLGATVLEPPFDVMDFGRMAVIRDPTGAVFCIWQPRKNPGTGITGVDGTVCWADLNTPGVDDARRFYSGLFGWEFEPGDSGYLHIKNEGQYIGGVPSAEQRNPNAPPHWLLYFQVSDCDAKTKVAANVLMPPMTLEKVGRFSIVADPQGAVLSLFQPLPH
jgi:predicted enzyme related to lactoylglutathione lyase